MTLSALNRLHQSRHVIALVLMATTAAACGISAITAAHDARAARQALCAARLDALRARNPFVEKFLVPSDKCLALEVVQR